MRQKSPFTSHAKDRANERYGIVFSRKQWQEFARILENPKFTVRLPGDRLACYFLKNWYLLVRAKDGTVTTFLAREAATDEDKLILGNDDCYRRINDDAFHVLLNPHLTTLETIPPLKENAVALPGDVALSSDVSQSVEMFLNRFCD
jgi:hypothetical protein